MPLYGKVGDLYGRQADDARRHLPVPRRVGGVRRWPRPWTSCSSPASCRASAAAGSAPLAMAVIADVVPARQLGRWLGYQGVIFAVSSVSGPLVGGLFVEHLSWRWAFCVNLPVGAVSMAIVATRLRVPVPADPPRPRLARSATAARHRAGLPRAGGHASAAASCRGRSFRLVAPGRRGDQPVRALPAARAAGARAGAAAADRSATRSCAMCVVINFTSGLLLWCGIFFVPLFVQEVRGVTPTRAGFVLMPLMFVDRSRHARGRAPGRADRALPRAGRSPARW